MTKHTHPIALRVWIATFAFALFALPTQAQSTVRSADLPQVRPLDHKSEAWWDRLEMQLAASMDAKPEQVRQETVRNIIFFATYYPDKVQFKDAVGDLLDIYQFDKDEANRTMALAALSAIGDEYSMQVLNERVQTERSERIRKLTHACLAQYQLVRDQAGQPG